MKTSKVFCDRCGKEITYNSNYGYIHHREYHILKIFNIKIQENDLSRDTDLCPECSNSFIHWFSNVEEEK